MRLFGQSGKGTQADLVQSITHKRKLRVDYSLLLTPTGTGLYQAGEVRLFDDLANSRSDIFTPKYYHRRLDHSFCSHCFVLALFW